MPVSGREATHDLVGVGAAFVAILIYQHFMPRIADIRTAPPFNTDIESAERAALVASSGFVLVTAGLTKSIEVFIIGGLAIVAVDYMTKHANAVHPDTGKMASPEPQDTGVSDSYPLPQYQDVG